jgi:hypothetical protein
MQRRRFAIVNASSPFVYNSQRTPARSCLEKAEIFPSHFVLEVPETDVEARSRGDLQQLVDAASRCRLSFFFFEQGAVPKDRELHSFLSVEIHLPSTASKKKNITAQPLQFAQRTLNKNQEKQSGPAPTPPRKSETQPTSMSPGTRPLGTWRREHAAPSPEGLRIGKLAWRLMKT